MMSGSDRKNETVKTYSPRRLGHGTMLCCVIVGMFVATSAAGEQPIAGAAGQADSPRRSPAEATKPTCGWMSLFDGKTLDGWKATKFGGEGEVFVKNGRLVLGMGTDLTGVTSTRELPRINYEVSLQAMRVDGTDFFCGLTFPVNQDPLTLIVGGWGGAVCGISSIDGQDASQNETTTYQRFENGRWYEIRLRVTETKVEAWIDKDKIVDQKITDRKLSIRPEVDLSKPFGIASWQTTAALRNVRIRKLQSADAP